MSGLIVDRAQIAIFADAVFRYANEGGYVALRAFQANDKPACYRDWSDVQLNGTGIAPLFDLACRLAQSVADLPQGATFCPPLCTFKAPKRATEADISEGLVLTVELDDRPGEARTRLEALLGRATVVVASGGIWTDPATGEQQDKLHLHYRLTEPARGPDDLALLKLLRKYAAAYAGGDKSAIPICHPIRWPGSWHTKARPRMSQIVAQSDTEIELAWALETLEQAVEAAGITIDGEGQHQPAGELQSEPEIVTAALLVIPNPDVAWDDWNRVGMAVWVATGGSEAGYLAFAAWSATSAKFDPRETRKRWEHFAKYPPARIGAGTLFHLAQEACPEWSPSKARIEALGKQLRADRGASPPCAPSHALPTATIEEVRTQLNDALASIFAAR